jgi:hypothetical protein
MLQLNMILMTFLNKRETVNGLVLMFNFVQFDSQCDVQEGIAVASSGRPASLTNERRDK